ncbi:peroxide stress protein YaaA [Pseudomonadota bacterium]
MLLLISPAKKLNFEDSYPSIGMTAPRLMESADEIATIMRDQSAKDIKQLMRLSDNLAELNYNRYQNWSTDISPKYAKQAILAFRGDVYQGMGASAFEQKDFDFAQRHLRILSGLYGILRPLDMIQAHRLEMGTKLKNPAGSNLYSFWQSRVTPVLEKDIDETGSTLINLASTEYFKAVDEQRLKTSIITPIFKDYKNGVYKIISLYAKQARGMMCSFSIRNQLQTPEQLKDFSEAGYRFCKAESDSNHYTFLRKKDSRNP